MINNKAISILKGLSKSEFIRFGKFLESPYYNANHKLTELYSILKRFYPSFESPQFTKLNIHEHLYGREKYNDEKLRKLFSEFYKLGEKYLVTLGLEKNKADYERLLLDELDHRKIDNIFLSKYAERESSLDRSASHYQAFYHLYHLKWQIVSFHLDRGEQYKIPPEVFERTEQLIFYFLSDLFISLNDIDVNRSAFNYSHKNNLPQKFIENLNLDSVYEFIQQNDFKNKDLFSMYYYLFLMTKHFGNETYFHKLKEIFDNNIDKLDKYGKMNFILRMITYCKRKMDKTKSIEFQNIRLELYDKYLRYKLYKMNQNYFRSDVFMHLFMIYISTGNISQANVFLEENIKSVNPSHVKNLLPLCKALILFEKGKFGEALALSSKIKTNIVAVKILLRKLLLKIFFETDDYDRNKDEANNFRHFIMYSKILNDENRNNLLMFLKNYNDLVKLKNDCKNDYLKNELMKNSGKIIDLLDKEWFMRKLNEMN